MSSPQSFYRDRVREYQSGLQTVQKRITGIALLRLAFFIGLAIALYYLISHFSFPVLFISILLAGAFAALIAISLRLKDRRALLEKLLFVNTNEAAVLANELNGFDNGQAFLSPEGYLDDLDIFGKRSLFHLLNRTTTSHGKDRLSGLLRNPLRSEEDIKQYQDAIRQLTGQTATRQLLTAQGLLHSEEAGNLHSLSGWLGTPARFLTKRWLLILRWIVIVYNIGSFLFYLSTDNYAPLLVGIAVAWAITGSFAAYINQQHVQIGKKQVILAQYATILNIFNAADAGNASLLQQLQSRTGKAHQAIRKLSQLSSFFDQRMNILVNIFLNSFFLFDLQCMIALERWKEAHNEDFPDWIGMVGSIESLNSLATFAFNNPEYTYPVPVPQTSPSAPLPKEGSIQSPVSTLHRFNLLLETQQMAHPLIPAAERIPNDFSTGHSDRLILVTGSNMSGKTTFLRTIGVNLLLAQCGAPVCAASFTFTPMQILTSLRVSDSLQEHTSYFMAELKKLQLIIRNLQSGLPSLVLIDEILRGTNSEDKTHGSEKFILRLLQYDCLSLFATHDLSLGQLAGEKPGVISNYCFESIIEHGELHFNYKLQTGVASNRNASFLMEKMEII
jgi:DNA mismatch repair ATPase MutS